MPARQPLPRAWLVTDERQGGRLLPAVARLPFGSGILFRHYSLGEAERRVLFQEIRAVARRRAHLLLLAGSRTRALGWGADGWHGKGRGAGLHSASVHDLSEIRAAERAGASILFLSPVYPTRSHPGTATLGPTGFARLTRRTELPVIALGGVDQSRALSLMGLGAYGWAAVDAWVD
jgi:thiamine-phosphate pyrophosphorylase